MVTKKISTSLDCLYAEVAWQLDSFISDEKGHLVRQEDFRSFSGKWSSRNSVGFFEYSVQIGQTCLISCRSLQEFGTPCENPYKDLHIFGGLLHGSEKVLQDPYRDL